MTLVVSNFIRTINALAKSCAATSKSKGFHDVVYTQEQARIITSIALIGTEVSELLDEYRKECRYDTPEFAAEGADIAIRLFDLFGKLDLDLGTAIDLKMTKNAGRPRMHGKAF